MKYQYIPPTEKKLFSAMKITDGALKKAFAFLRTITEEFSSSTEGYLFLLGRPGSDLVTDVYLPQQKAGAVEVDVEPEHVVSASEDIVRGGNVVLGWSHSHPHGFLSPSSKDLENNVVILNERSSENYKTVYRRMHLGSDRLKVSQNGKGIVLESDRDGLERVSLNFSSDAATLEGLTSADVEVPVHYSYIYSLIIDPHKASSHRLRSMLQRTFYEELDESLADRDRKHTNGYRTPYVEIAVRRWTNVLATSECIPYKIKLTVVRREDDIQFSRDDLAAIVRDRVARSSVFIGFPNRTL